MQNFFVLRSQPLLRAFLASAGIAAPVTLAGCGTAVNTSRHMQPLSERVLAELKAKKMEKESPILIRIFKEEAELEVWKQDDSGRFALLRTYPICRWSGQLGPKLKTGDRQAPEGFYTITPGLMNPDSNHYLAINTGFPNAYDRANGRTGTFLMIHGGCSSAGCYAMTDEQIAEIYALAREAFLGGQQSFQLQAYPTISRSRTSSPRSMYAKTGTFSASNQRTIVPTDAQPIKYLRTSPSRYVKSSAVMRPKPPN